MSGIKQSFQLVRRNWKALICFELLYKAVTTAVAVPLLRLICSGLMRLLGYSYLTADQFPRFLAHPVTIAVGLALAFLLTFYAMIDIGAIIYILDMSAQETETTVMAAMKFSVRNTARIFNIKNILLVLFVIVMMPFASLGVASGFLSSLSVPSYIHQTVSEKWQYALPYYGTLFFVFFVVMRWLFLFHYFTLEGCTFHDARRSSIRLTQGRRLFNLLILIIVQACLYLFFLGDSLVGMFLIAVTQRLADPGIWISILYSGTGVLLGILFTTVHALSLPATYAVITVLFYRAKEKKGEPVAHLKPESNTARHRKRFRVAAVCLVIAAITGGTYYIYGRAHSKYDIPFGEVERTEVTAHRGAAADYPENTMAAFWGAYEQGADWIELDVQQCADGTLIVMHDSSFRRTCGVDKNVWEVTWDEVREMDAGSSFSKTFAGEPVPMLEDAIDFALQTGLRLNIDLKPNRHDAGLEERLADLIRKKHFERQCVVSAMDLQALQDLKAYDDDIRTVYTLNMAFGHIEEFEGADDFSVEELFASRALLDRLHEQGRNVFVWTVDSENEIQKMIDYGADNIITDDVPRAKQLVSEDQVSDRVIRVLRRLVTILS